MPVDLVQLLHSSIGRIIRGLDANIFKLWLRQACILSPIVGIVIQSRITGCFSQLFLAELKEMRMSSAEARWEDNQLPHLLFASSLDLEIIQNTEIIVTTRIILLAMAAIYLGQ